jgi:type I restriction enzyme S subunit
MSLAEKSLDQLGTVARGKSRHRPRNDPSLYGGPYPFIQTADITNSELYISDYSQTYSELGLAQSKLWEPGTLCIVNAGVNTGDCAILGFRACFPDSVISFLPDEDCCDVRFVKYFLDSVKESIRSITMGATQDNLSVSKLLTVKLPAFALAIQRKIAGVLSAYDDLIENNRRRVAILEHMAEEIYREWFVRMRFPGYQNAKFVKGVPEGWELKRLNEVLELCYGKALKADDRVPGDCLVYGSGGIVGTHNRSVVNGPGLIVGRKGNVGSVYYSDQPFFPIDTVYYVKSDLSTPFLYYLLQSMNFINNDAAIPGLNRNQAYSNQFFLPADHLLNQFDDIANGLRAQRTLLSKANRNLTKSRDLLLGRIISGKLPVDDLDIRLPPSMIPEDAEELAHA